LVELRSIEVLVLHGKIGRWVVAGVGWWGTVRGAVIFLFRIRPEPPSSLQPVPSSYKVKPRGAYGRSKCHCSTLQDLSFQCGEPGCITLASRQGGHCLCVANSSQMPILTSVSLQPPGLRDQNHPVISFRGSRHMAPCTANCSWPPRPKGPTRPMHKVALQPLSSLAIRGLVRFGRKRAACESRQRKAN
jgi:hypothetical protein